MRVLTPSMPCYFFFTDPAATEIYTLSLHDALPICGVITSHFEIGGKPVKVTTICHPQYDLVAVRVESDLVDRKSTRLNSSHSQISYAVFCLKKKTKTTWSRPTHP